MTENRNSETQSVSAIDPELQLLKMVIMKGWPTDKLGIPVRNTSCNSQRQNTFIPSGS